MSDLGSGSINAEPVPVRPRRGPSTLGWVLIAVAAVVLAGGGVVAGVLLSSGHATAKATPTAVAVVTPIATPTLARLDEETACDVLVPELTDAANIITAIVATPDGSTVNQELLAATIGGLTQAQNQVPADMSSRVGDEIVPLSTLQAIFQSGQNRQLDLVAFRASGTSLTLQCAKYAH